MKFTLVGIIFYLNGKVFRKTGYGSIQGLSAQKASGKDWEKADKVEVYLTTVSEGMLLSVIQLTYKGKDKDNPYEERRLF